MVFKLYHDPTQQASLVAVGINFALALVNVLTNFLVLLKAADKLAEAASAAVFSPRMEPLLACSRLLLFSYMRLKDDFAGFSKTCY